jgi:hypothetical protein
MSTMSSAGSSRRTSSRRRARLTGVCHQVQEHLLNLVADRPHGRDRGPLRTATLYFITRSNHERFLDDGGQVYGANCSDFGQAQHAVGDLLGPLSGGEDLFKCLVAGGVVFVAHSQLGVVEDGHQHVVEFVRRGAHQFAKRRHPLGLKQLLLERFELLLEGELAA